MAELRIAHTSALGEATLREARALLDGAFEDMTDDDWEHALGGMHALVRDGDELVGHAAVVQRRLLLAGRALRAGYVEGVAVRADRRREGHGAALLAALERIVGSAHELGALSAADEAIDFYSARGWLRWRGPISTLTPGGIVRTAAEQETILVLPVALPLDLDAELTCDWREGEPW